MRELGLLVSSHPALPWCWLFGALAIAWTAREQRRRRPRTCVTLGWTALATSVVLALGPQPIGYLVGTTDRVCEVDQLAPMAPWGWATADARVGPILLMGLVGAIGAAVGGRSGRGLAAAAVLTIPICELLQWFLPQIGRTCSTTDVTDGLSGLLVGGAVGWLLARMPASTRRRQIGIAVATAGAVLVVATQVAARPVGAPPTLRTDPAYAQLTPRAERIVQRWVGSGSIPGAGTRWEPMARAALRDLWLATSSLDGLPPAGPAAPWGYFWPRDGSFMTVALARTGHTAEALRLLRGMAALPFDLAQGLDARFLLGGDPVYLDPRAPQFDNCGWVLWAIHEVGERTVLPRAVQQLRHRCVGQLLRLTGAGSHLPGPSADYWEVTTWRRLLGVSAPVLLGLRVAAQDLERAGDPSARRVREAAVRFARVVHRDFGPGYQRFGDSGGLDASVAVLLPPFAPAADPVVVARWRAYQRLSRRPAGGLAPGAEWKQDGISWTPQVALTALAAAGIGERKQASTWLDWLGRHRVPWGSLPEKVRADGRPAGPAPLHWTAALVLLTLSEMDA